MAERVYGIDLGGIPGVGGEALSDDFSGVFWSNFDR
jgi:hypothetical protein